MAMWKFTRWYYSRRRNSHWYRKNAISIYIIFLLEEQTQRVFRKMNLQKWSHMEVSMRNIATNWWMFHCHLWFYCKTVGFYCISLIFLDVYIFIYPIGSMYGIYANIWCILMVNVTIYSIHGSYGYIYIYLSIYLSLYLWFTDLLYIYILHDSGIWMSCHNESSPKEDFLTLGASIAQCFRFQCFHLRDEIRFVGYICSLLGMVIYGYITYINIIAIFSGYIW